MTRLYRPVLVLVVIILIIAGLNTSNQGTNSLTAEARKPVFSLKIENKNLSVIALGEQYTYSRQDFIRDSSGAKHEAETLLRSAGSYFKKIWKIFRVLVLE